MRTRPILAAAIVVMLLCAGAAYAAEIAGTWVGKTEVPGGTDEVTLVLKKTDTGSYAGTVSDSMGQVPEGTEIKNVTWSDNVLVFAFALADGASVKLTLRLESGKLNGNWVHEGGDSGSIVLEKK